MLNRLDDYPVHQIPEPLAQPATSDRNFYDRTWFNGYVLDGSWFFGITMAVYPHLGVLDCAFSVVRPGGRQHCFFASRRAPAERTEMCAGPLRIDVIAEPMAGAAHRVTYYANTRLAQHAEVELHGLAGERREISLTPTLRFQMKGLGYGHPQWRHGVWHDELALGQESFDPEELDLLAPENLHVQQVVRARDGSAEGIGVLEQAAIGPYAPAGFRSHFDGAAG